MLKRIRCDKFNQKEIVFHEGLNAVIGDDLASNSIGKSTLLMIIDFVFGGKEYIKTNRDAIEQLGHHEFQFEFEFKGENLYFSRSTNSYLFVNRCDSDYQVQGQINLEDYHKLLQNKYQCELDGLGFRAIVGRYFRIYGKENLNEHKPIQYFEKESYSKSILALVKLFNKYSTIKTYEEQIATLGEEKKILVSAAKRDLIPTVSKTAFSQNNKKIISLSQQLEQVKKDIVSASTDITALISEEILQLRKEKSSLIVKRNILSSRLQRIQANLQNKGANLKFELEQFALYFPDFNVEQAKNVDAFHDKLTSILRSELQSAEKDLRSQILELNAQINQIEARITEKLNIRDAPKIAVEKVVDLAAQIKQLTVENGYFTRAQDIEKNLKTATSDLAALKERVLDDICNQVNTKMYELNKEIYGESRRAPTLNIHGDRYSFSTYGDTGTGTAFANLITFDLALLDLTCLPAVAHDLPLLKNIENPAMEKIIFLYAASKKQIFIAIDKIHSYDPEAASVVESHGVIQLSKNKTLFIKNWKNTQTI
ncbi:DUF2326 domain-containing protein [Anaerotignum lactatifermentans]|uniref:DUF2326 domain-containing protein n=1 Tax=Anaerotignum lactatifermentans TaxID=160404 RepID=UPI00174AC737|nr:DUF2326 domain-containing protein [Anaerotignum lactatifermentans]HJE93701.1 DUF2326 domain-containing protein [Anaerotignum lactatifermentans]